MLRFRIPKSDYHRKMDKLVVCPILFEVKQQNGQRQIVVFKHRFLGLMDATRDVPGANN